MSLRQRLVATSLAIMVAGLGVVLVIGNVLVAKDLSSDSDNLLHARAEAQLAAIALVDGHIRVRKAVNDRVLDEQAWVIEGHRVVERPTNADPALDRIAVAMGTSGRPSMAAGPDDSRLLTADVDAQHRRVGAVVVALSVLPWVQLQREILIGSIVVAFVIVAVGWWVIRRAVDGALRPVAEMTASANEWGADDVDRRFALGPARDELTGLAATLDGLLDRIAASRRYEQRFAGDVAHELRTPLAGLRARAELAQATADPETRQELDAIIDRADELNATIDDLLVLARQELDPAAGTVDLAEVCRSFDDVHVCAGAGVPKAEGQPDVVRRAISPLVDNARRFAAQRVWIEVSAVDSTVRAAVRDDGPGLAGTDAERVFEPGVSGGRSSGHAGLGLPLARRLARSCGGDVVVGGGPGGHFELRLPAVGSPA